MKLALSMIVLLVGMMVPNLGMAEAIFKASNGGVEMTLYTEPCEFQDTVALPLKATWTENGKTVPGCWAAIPDLKVLVFYFPSDRSVFAVHMGNFTRLQGA